MGVIHKLRDDVKNLIVEKKKGDLSLSCRALSVLIKKELDVEVSKSSINFIIKEAGLSAPIGRKSKKPKKAEQLKEALKLALKPTTTPLAPIEEPQAPPTAQVPQEPAPTINIEPREEKIILPEPVAEPEIQKPEPLKLEPIEEPEPIAEEPQMPSAPPEVPQEIIAPAIEPAKEKIPEEIPEVKEEAITKAAESFSSNLYPGAIILKAADYLLGGASCIADTIKNSLRSNDPDILAKTEGLIYSSLFEQDLSPLWSLTGKKISAESLKAFSEKLESNKQVALDILRTISSLLQEVRFIKVVLSAGGVFHIDGQMHTVWSTPYIPYDFSNTINNTRAYLKKRLTQENSFLLFMAPGYDTPTQEFLNFLKGLEDKDGSVKTVSLHGNKLEELESFSAQDSGKQHLIFGLWPWQFVEYRKVKKLGEFKFFYSEALNKDLYLAEIELDLMAPDGSRSFSLRGYALKVNPKEKTRLVILSNLLAGLAKQESLVEAYLRRWPNLEEAFQDTNRKIELFTYTAGSQRFFSADNSGLRPGSSCSDIKEFFKLYLDTLDAYARWHFLPTGYEDTTLATTKERFYNLNGLLKKQGDSTLITFQPPQGFAFSKEAGYLCRRLNEKEITLPDAGRLWFSIL